MTLSAPAAGVPRDTVNTSHKSVTASGYAVAPNVVLRDGRLSVTARLLYAILDGRQTSSASVRVGLATLAADMGVSDDTVSRAAAELEAVGYLSRTRTGRTSRYAIRNPYRSDVERRAAAVEPELPLAEPRTRTAAESDTARVRLPQRNISGGINIITGTAQTSSAEASESATAAAASSLEAYVEAIAQATRLPLRPTADVLGKVRKIAARGLTPAEAAEAAQSRLLVASGIRDLYSPVGFLARTVLTDLAEGTPVPVEAVTLPSLPPRFIPEPDRGGDPVAGVAAIRAALRGEASSHATA